MSKTIASLITLAVAASLLAAVSAHAETLDGTKWKIKVVPDKETAAKGEKKFGDTLIFADGKITATTCVRYGFKVSEYTTETKAGSTQWKTQQVSEKEGTADWSGEIKGQAISGEMTWVKKDATKLHYTYTGTKQ